MMVMMMELMVKKEKE